MKKEDLLKLKMDLKEAISKKDVVKIEELRNLLNISDQQAKYFSDGLTGYPSIDKVWSKHYNQDNINKTYPKRTVYQEVYENNRDYMKDLALEYFGTRINYHNLFFNIDETAKALKEYGVKKGDFVTICVAGIPETVYTFYALSKIGAIANMISPFFEKEDLINRISDCESDMLIIMDKFYSTMEDAIKKSRIKNIVIVPTLNSSLLRLISKSYKPNSNEVLWNQFIKDGKYRNNDNSVPYEKNIPLAMVYSSGTTGASKGILLSNDSFQNSIQSYPASGVDISRGQKFYQIIPPWFSTGLSTSIHLPLSYGTSVFMDPRFERDIFVKNILKVKPNYAVAPTSMYEGFLNEKLLKNKNLSFFNYPFEGGEPLKEEVQDKIESIFKQHGSDALLRTAYGQCECGAAITTQTQQNTTGKSSVGIPLPRVNVKIVDDEFNELSYYERGQILVDTPCGMLGYYKNPDATNKYFYIGDDGVKWSCTDDIGYIDKDGNLYVQGRASDYSIINNKKVFNFDIENVIMNDKDVKMCDVLPKISCSDGCQELVAHIVFEDTAECIYDESKLNEKLLMIQEMIYEQTNDLDFVPYIFKIRDNFPYAKSGKRDTKKILDETDGFLEINKYTNNPKTKKLS